MNLSKYLLEDNETWRHFFIQWGLFQWKVTVYVCAVIGVLSMLRIIRW